MRSTRLQVCRSAVPAVERSISLKKLYCIPKLDELSQFIAFSEKYNAGFEYNDFFLPAILDDPDEVKRRVDIYCSINRDRSEDTLHGVFLDICVNSDDPKIQEVSDFRIHQSMDIATELGVRAVIFHTNHIPNFRLQTYRTNWLSRNATYWKKLLNEYPAVEVYVENMFDDEPDLLLALAKELSDVPHFGVCLDFAHAYLSKTPLQEWNNALRPYTRHLHINDNFQMEDTHNPVGNGSLPWEVYRDFIDAFSPEERPSVLIEVRSYKDLLASVAYMKQKKLYPF